MKRIIFIIILIFSLQSLSKADDISDFQIEGMSIGDSLLDYFSEGEIKKYTVKMFAADEYITIQFPGSFLNSTNYDVIEINYKKNNTNLVIANVSGVKFYEKINQCYNKQDEILGQIKELFTNVNDLKIIDKYIDIHGADQSGKSTYTRGSFKFASGDKISIDCNNFSKAMNTSHQLYVSIDSKEFDEFLDSGRAY